MEFDATSVIDLSAWVIILALILERIRRLEDKIMNCIFARIEELNEKVARIEERIRK